MRTASSSCRSECADLGGRGVARGPMMASNPRRVGRGCPEGRDSPFWSGFQGAQGLLVDGMVPRKGSAKAPFLVSMKWSGVSGAGTPLGRWVQGERRLPARDGTATRSCGFRNGLDALRKPLPGGMEWGRGAGPLPQVLLYYSRQLAERAKPTGCGLRSLSNASSCGPRLKFCHQTKA